MRSLKCSGCSSRLDVALIRQHIIDNPIGGYECPHSGCGRSWTHQEIMDIFVKLGVDPPVVCTSPPATEKDEDSLSEWFETYHAENPQVYEAFKEIAREKLQAGHKCYGAKTIMEIIRWESAVRYGWSDFKLNNNIKDRCSARYVRLLQQEDPTFTGFFETRRVTSAAQRKKLGYAHRKRTEESAEE